MACRAMTSGKTDLDAEVARIKEEAGPHAAWPQPGLSHARGARLKITPPAETSLPRAAMWGS